MALLHRKTLSALLILALVATSAWALDMGKLKLPSKTLKKKTRGSSSSVASIRGLDEPEGTGDSSARDYGAVERMENLALTREEIEKFRREGNLK